MSTKAVSTAGGISSPPAIIELDTATAVLEMAAAWKAYQKTEKYGVEFGRVCCEWRDKFKAQGKKGRGLVHVLDELTIPKSTAYWWMDKYEVGIGTKVEAVPAGIPTKCSACDEKFPSKGQAKKHERKEHPEVSPDYVRTDRVCFSHEYVGEPKVQGDASDTPVPETLLHRRTAAHRKLNQNTAFGKSGDWGAGYEAGHTDGYDQANLDIEPDKEIEVDLPDPADFVSYEPVIEPANHFSFWANFRIKLGYYGPVSSGMAQQISGDKGIRRGFAMLHCAVTNELDTPTQKEATRAVYELEDTAIIFMEVAKRLRERHGVTGVSDYKDTIVGIMTNPDLLK